MINLAVINLKLLIKKILKICFIVLIIVMILKLITITYFKLKQFNFKTDLNIIKNNILVANYFENKEMKKSSSEKILIGELAIFSGAEEQLMEKENQEEVLEFETPIENDNKQENNQLEKVESSDNLNNKDMLQPENVKTSIVENNNKKDVFTNQYESVQIKNESNYDLTDDILRPDIKYSNNKDIIIYHTHTCESYTPTENSRYIETGNFRTTDLNYSVVRVGDELMNELAGKGYTPIHDRTYHDYPAYTGSYNRSLSTIKNLLSTYKGVDAVFDIHRDALRK